MAWVYLLIAGVFEIVWAIGLKYTDGFTRVIPILVVIGGMAVSLVFLAIAMRSIPVGTAYAVWTGIGAAGTAIVAMFLFGESAAPLRLACLGLIVGGIVGLKLASPG
jgi:quaternary ammonium compound-resistance protein SugE